MIDGSSAWVAPAHDLWGLSAAEAEARLRERMGPAWRVAAIGPAGERGVRYATVSHDGRHAGRGGLGAVLGSKWCKAVMVRARTKVASADPPAVLAAAKDLRQRSFGQATAKYRELGTMANLLAFNAISALPTRNFSAATFDGAEALSAEQVAELRQVARNSCASCSIGCEHLYKSRGGKKVRMEYENVFALGPLCGVNDPDAVIAASGRCDELGLDTISTGGTIAWAMECAEKGLIDAPWLRFGDGEALLRAIEEIGAREGIGDLLAEGSRFAARMVGHGSEAFAAHVKGLELPGYEPRTLQAMALGLAVNARGADHNRSGAYEADLSGRARPAAGRGTPRARRDRDRGPCGDHGLSDPVQVPARRLRGPAGGVGAAAQRRHRLGYRRRRAGAHRAADRDDQAAVQPARGLDPRGGLAAPPVPVRAGGARLRQTGDAQRGAPGVHDQLVLPRPRPRADGSAARQDPRRARPRGPRERFWTNRSKQGRLGPMATTSATQPTAITKNISLRIDGQEVTVRDGTTILQAAAQLGIAIPVLCHDDRYDPVGVCRMCVVDIGARAFAAACVRPCEEGMEVVTTGERLDRHRATLTELLLADQPDPAQDPKETTTGDNELLVLVRQYGVEKDEEQLPQGHGRGIDDSNPVIAVNHDACILCDRCVRACDDIQGNDVIGRSGKGYSTRIAFDLNDPMGDSSCVTCGECVAACPTGALTNKPLHGVPIRPRTELRQVDTVCPYCGVGCALTYNVDDERKAIAFAEGRPQPGSKGRLCVKGRYGWDYARSPQRLTKPLIRREDAYPKGPLSTDVRGDEEGGRSDRRRKPGGLVDYDQVMPSFREASWEEALDLVARRLTEIHADGGPAAIAGFGSAKCSNEEAYLFQKLIRTGFHTNNVDHCTRLCHASSVAALFEGIGSGAVSTTYGDVINADVIIITGSNATANHPVASSFFKQARRLGTTIIYVDPRADKVADHADIFCQLKPGTDVAFYNAVMHEIIRLGLVDEEFIRPDVELRGAGGDRRGLPARARRADHRRQRRADPPGRADLGRGERRNHLLGDGDLAAHHGHRQRALPDRDVLDHRQRRPAGHRPAPPARPEQRPGRVGRRADPDVLPGLQGRRRRGDAGPFREAWGETELDPDRA